MRGSTWSLMHPIYAAAPRAHRPRRRTLWLAGCMSQVRAAADGAHACSAARRQCDLSGPMPARARLSPSLCTHARSSMHSSMHPRMHAAPFVPAEATVHIFTEHGQLLKTFCDSDGSFIFLNVPKGQHVLQAQLLGMFYPEVCQGSSKTATLHPVPLPGLPAPSLMPHSSPLPHSSLSILF